jgi:hypothetical protein
MARNRPVFDLGGPIGNHHHPSQMAGSGLDPSPGSTFGSAAAEGRYQLFPETSPPVQIQRPVVRLRRHPPVWLIRMLQPEPTSDLLRRPTTT